ncbi:MAG: hypothetical protein CMN30_08005 [Sandaracinus sp.]|nr:hypothetical protein [Sandaracinus sp.]
MLDRCLISAVLAASLALGACAGSDGNELSVDVRTDWVAPVEFDSVWVRVGADSWQTHTATATEAYIRGVRVAQIAGVASGRQTLYVQLRDGESVLAERELPVDVKGDLAVTVLFSRDCADVVCDGDLTCVGGTCVENTCTPETPETCPPDECTLDDDCGSGVQSCLEPTCAFGVCLFGDDGSCGSGSYCDPEAGCTSTGGDMGPRDMGMDQGVDFGVDFGHDLGPGCGGVFCEAFEFCNAMVMCEPYPGCLTDTECLDGAICRNRRCIPPAADPDGDGSPASEDCDESNADRYPGNEESCDDVDEDCDDTVDEGNPGILCANAMMAGECMAGGVCACPDGFFDVDGTPDNGCECLATPPVGQGADCGSAIDLGTVRDDGGVVTASGNGVPMGREVWYRFLGQDSADATCDNYHVDVRFTTNPGDNYRLEVLRGSCAATAECDMPLAEYKWATDFRTDLGGRLSGQCPCGVRITDQSACQDDSANYFVRVTRADVPASCDEYTLQVSNGLYDWP